MKIGIMGGTFDPIHNGHLMLGEAAYQQFDLDEVWFMPNGKPPHKKEQNISCSIQERLQLVKLAIEDVPYFRLSEVETSPDKIYYSYATMEMLKQKFIQDEFYFIIGADSLFQFDTWVHPQRLVKCCNILVACRNGSKTTELEGQISYLNRKYHGKFQILDSEDYPVSSTRIRELLSQGELISDWMPPKVVAYIMEKHLYKKESVGNE